MIFNSSAIINPPSPEGYVSNKDSMGGFGQLYPVGATYFPPMDMAYLIGFLESKGHLLEVFECLGSEWDEEKLIEEAKRLKSPSLLVIRTSDPTLVHDIEIAEKIKNICPEHKLSLYGPVIEHRADIAKSSQALSYLFIGEAEEAVDDILSGKDPRDVPNLIYRDGSRKWRQTKRTTVNKELDMLPFPAWERMPHEAYQTPKSSTVSKMKFLPVLASRGCPYGCDYCPYPVSQGLQRRTRSPENVVDEIEHLNKNLGVNYILFRDPVFSLNKKCFMDICK